MKPSATVSSGPPRRLLQRLSRTPRVPGRARGHRHQNGPGEVLSPQSTDSGRTLTHGAVFSPSLHPGRSTWAELRHLSNFSALTYAPWRSISAHVVIFSALQMSASRQGHPAPWHPPSPHGCSQVARRLVLQPRLRPHSEASSPPRPRRERMFRLTEGWCAAEESHGGSRCYGRVAAVASRGVSRVKVQAMGEEFVPIVTPRS